MGKSSQRQRRRKRQAKGGGKQPQQQKKAVLEAPPRILLPSAERPLAELHIAPETPPEVREVCVAYWSFDEPGAWSLKVSEIGSPQQVLKAVKPHAHLSLLTVVCPGCASPLTATSRSEVQATGFWGADYFPASPVTASVVCSECRVAAEAVRAEESKRAEEKRQAQAQERLANASAWMERQKDGRIADADPDTLAALALLAMTEIMERTGGDSVGPLKKLPYTLTGSRSRDTEVTDELFVKGWVIPTLPATTGDFAFNDDNTVSGVYIAQVPWAIAGWLGAGAKGREGAASDMHLALRDDFEAVREVLLDIEATMVVHYLEGLLTRKYNEEPIPEHRLPDAHDIARRTLAEGFTLGQMIAVCWSAVAGSVAWGQRTPSLKPGSVSSAAVTNLERRIGYAKDRAAVEYDLPNWVDRPAIRSTAQRFLERHQAAYQALTDFRALQQRINSRPLDAVELDDDLADPQQGEYPDIKEWFENYRSGVPRQADAEPEVAFAMVEPTGDLAVRNLPLAEMRDVAGAPYGAAERLPLDGTRGLMAYIPEFASHEDHPANVVGALMVRLLGGGAGPVNGNVVFCRLDQENRPQSLDPDLRELVALAHRVARHDLGLLD